MEAIQKSRWFRAWPLPVAGLLAVIALLPAGTAPVVGVADASMGWKSAPILPVVKGKTKRKLIRRVARGKRLGMRATFAKVGDSNIEMTPGLYGLACADPVGLPPALRPTLRRYGRVRLANQRAFPGCRPWNSFSRRSAAAQGGTHSTWSLVVGSELPDSGYLGFPTDCAKSETPLGCELRVTRPRYAFVLTGTNDFSLDHYLGLTPGAEIGARLKQVLKALLANGTVPILNSIPPRADGTEQERAGREMFVNRTNAGIRRLARSMNLPFINLWRAMSDPWMVNQGMDDGGLHLSLFGAEGKALVREVGPTTFADSVVFSRQGLRYGSNRRNLIWLKTLARLDRVTRGR